MNFQKYHCYTRGVYVWNSYAHCLPKKHKLIHFSVVMVLRQKCINNSTMVASLECKTLSLKDESCPIFKVYHYLSSYKGTQKTVLSSLEKGTIWEAKYLNLFWWWVPQPIWGEWRKIQYMLFSLYPRIFLQNISIFRALCIQRAKPSNIFSLVYLMMQIFEKKKRFLCTVYTLFSWYKVRE